MKPAMKPAMNPTVTPGMKMSTRLRGTFRASANAMHGRWLRAFPALAVLLAACSNQPRMPDWQLNAKAASDRFVEAELTGNTRVAALELGRARHALSATGRADLMARLELLACATRQASLDFSPCAAFEALRGQAAPAERAYADYLSGQLEPGGIDLLPAPQRPLARQLILAVRPSSEPSVPQSTDEPLSRLLASAVLLRAGQASPAVLQGAINIASDQGWRKPLLAWLGVAAQRAEQAGNAQEAERLRSRMALVAPSRLAPTAAQPAAPAVSAP
jgi:hypothetical protein